MAFIVFTRRNIAAIKALMRTALPDLGSAHADEALAAGIGFRTHAAMLAALKAQSGAKLTVLLNEQSLSERLMELTGTAPDRDTLFFRALGEADLPDPPELLRLGQWWRQVANEN